MVVFHSYASLPKGIWVGRSSPKVLQAPRFAAGPPLQLHPQGHEETFPALEEGSTFSQNVHQMNISYRCIYIYYIYILLFYNILYSIF